MMVIMQTTRFLFNSVFLLQMHFQNKKSKQNINATGIGRKHDKNDFMMYVDYPKIVILKVARKQSNEIIVSDVWPITYADENAFLKKAGY